MLDYALRFFTIDNFPRLPNIEIGWEFLSEFGAESLAAPDPLHENRLEGEGRINRDHRAEITGQRSQVICRPSL
jgi:hypothetical protein